jgi:hypothetical protein
MLHYNPRHVSSINMSIFRRTNCIINIKICNAEQAKQVYQYKNTKIKLYNNNAAIWYKKNAGQDRQHQHMPKYKLKVKTQDVKEQKTQPSSLG